MLKKISNKIIISYTVFILFLLLFLSFFFRSLISETHTDILKREMEEQLDFIELALDQSEYSSIESEQVAALLKSVSDINNMNVGIIDYDGNIAADTGDLISGDNIRYEKDFSKALLDTYGCHVDYSSEIKSEILYCSKKTPRFIIRLSVPLADINHSLKKLKSALYIIGLSVIGASILVIIILSQRITGPIRETLNFAKQISEGNFSKRILNYSEDEIGEVQRALNRMADILVEKINSLIFEQNKLQITLESIADGIAVIDNNKKILISNRAFNTIFDYDVQTTTKLFFEVIRSRKLNAKIDSTLISGEDIRYEDKLINGKYYQININPIKEEKSLQGILLVMHDITEKKKIEQMKTDLVGNMSHELKTPITIMKGYLETINENIENPDTSRDYIKKALDSANRQNSIINDILKLNMIETTQDFTSEVINLVEIIENCIEVLKPKYNKKLIDIVSDTQAIQDAEVQGNRFLVEEVFFNIIDNAINYTNSDGKVTIKATNTRDSIKVSVSDNGIGIPEESIDRIFERFYRVDKSRSRETGGTGLGLSIVKHAVELLNWDISVTSSDDGTTFTIYVS